MSSQIGINEKLISYLETIGYRSDAIIDQLVSETAALGSVAQMQIAPEQGQFLEIIVKISQSINCLEIGRFTGLSTLCIAKGLPANGKIIAVDNSNFDPSFEFTTNILGSETSPFDPVPFLIKSTNSIPFTTFPKTVYSRSKKADALKQIKN